MKIFLITFVLFVSIVFANKGDRLFWEEVKNSNDIELLRVYQKEYPNGIFHRLAEIKIKRLKKEEYRSNRKDESPSWIRGDINHKYFGIGVSNRHYKGIDYQKNVAKSKAKKEMLKLLKRARFSEKRKHYYFRSLETKTYIDKNKRVYVLVYIPNYIID